MPDARSHHSLNVVSSMTSASTSKLSGFSSLSHPHLSHSVVSLQLSGKTSVVPSPPAAEVALLQSPSTEVPLAPDCELLVGPCCRCEVLRYCNDYKQFHYIVFV